MSGKNAGVVPGGRFPRQATDRRLNHGPREDRLTPESVTATGYRPILPSAQLGWQSFSQYVASPVAVVPVQSVQVTCSTPAPPSPQASVMNRGRTLSRLEQSAITLGRTAGTAAGDEAARAAGVGTAVGPGEVATFVGVAEGATGAVGVRAACGAAVMVWVTRGAAAAWVCPGEQAVRLTVPATASSEQRGNVRCESLMSPGRTTSSCGHRELVTMGSNGVTSRRVVL